MNIPFGGSMYDSILAYPPITPRRFYEYAPTRRKKFKRSSRQYPNRRTK